jgi:hypothetical protein
VFSPQPVLGSDYRSQVQAERPASGNDGVELLLADPEALANDALEGDLYVEVDRSA